MLSSLLWPTYRQCLRNELKRLSALALTCGACQPLEFQGNIASQHYQALSHQYRAYLGFRRCQVRKLAVSRNPPSLVVLLMLVASRARLESVDVHEEWKAQKTRASAVDVLLNLRRPSHYSRGRRPEERICHDFPSPV